MRKIITILAALLTASVLAQSPQKLNYQAVIRDGGNNLVTNHPVGIKTSILQGSISGTAVYVEIFNPNPTTNNNGLVTIEIGGGIALTGTFSTINWANGVYFIKTETDPVGGTNYTISGTSQLLSVPYALYAETAKAIIGSHYLGEEYLGGIIFYLYLDNTGAQRGLVISKTESTATWGGSTLVGADKTSNGAYNMALMPTGAGTARTWVETLGVGWYLPSIDELNILYQNRFHVNNSSANGLTLLPGFGSYWSSTEFNATYAWYFGFNQGPTINYSKSPIYSVRAVRAF